jgi:hypothetical protein
VGGKPARDVGFERNLHVGCSRTDSNFDKAAEIFSSLDFSLCALCFLGGEISFLSNPFVGFVRALSRSYTANTLEAIADAHTLEQ